MRQELHRKNAPKALHDDAANERKAESYRRDESVEYVRLLRCQRQRDRKLALGLALALRAAARTKHINRKKFNESKDRR